MSLLAEKSRSCLSPEWVKTTRPFPRSLKPTTHEVSVPPSLWYSFIFFPHVRRTFTNSNLVKYTQCYSKLNTAFCLLCFKADLCTRNLIIAFIYSISSLCVLCNGIRFLKTLERAYSLVTFMSLDSKIILSSKQVILVLLICFQSALNESTNRCYRFHGSVLMLIDICYK